MWVPVCTPLGTPGTRTSGQSSHMYPHSGVTTVVKSARESFSAVADRKSGKSGEMA